MDHIVDNETSPHFVDNALNCILLTAELRPPTTLQAAWLYLVFEAHEVGTHKVAGESATVIGRSD